MATEGGPSPRSAEDRRRSLTCTWCLDICTQRNAPIPCPHTFCTECLEGLTAHQSSSTFRCPYCRAEVTVPAEGVSAFPNNVHIRHEDLDMAREETHCLIHPDQYLDLFCRELECQVPVCLKCVVTKHKLHNTHDLSEEAKAAKEQLTPEKDRLQEVESCMTRLVEEEEEEQKSLRGKKAAIKSTIFKKYVTVVALAEKCRDELLASVDTACVQMEDEVNTTLSTRTNRQHYLCQLQHRLEQTLTTGKACSLVTLAKEIREGQGSAQTVEEITSTRRSTITRPVLNSSHTLDTLTENVQNFFGTVETMEMKQTAAKVVVEKKFMCKTEPDTEVFSLCPLDHGTVCVSYASCGLQDNALSDCFEESGQHQKTQTTASGKRSWKRRGNGNSMFCKSSNSEFSTHSKYRGHDNHHLRLSNKLHGKADILKDEVTSEDPFTTETVTEFTIKVGPHRAFDVDSSEQFFAVVEEPQAPDHQRQVKLYQRNKPDAIATYTPPSKPFNPADVCFITQGGEEGLMIADEAGDSIHVVHVQAGRLTFVCHLAPGCPLLVQPTALNTDHRGRLWVACRGGAILTMSPLSS